MFAKHFSLPFFPPTAFADDDAARRERGDGGRRSIGVAIAAEPISAGRVEADHDKVRELGPRRLGAGEQQRGQGEPAGAPHGSRSSGAM